MSAFHFRVDEGEILKIKSTAFGIDFEVAEGLTLTDGAKEFIQIVEELLERDSATDSVLTMVGVERRRQDSKWGGSSHDDKHTTHDFIRWIKNYACWADQMADAHSWSKARSRLVQVAALAVAAVEQIDRRNP